jgi:hypothetical protein
MAFSTGSQTTITIRRTSEVLLGGRRRSSSELLLLCCHRTRMVELHGHDVCGYIFSRWYYSSRDSRGYFGDKTAPERLLPAHPPSIVRAGPIVIRGVTDVKTGPIQYQSLWKNEEGYLRPAELATVRLRSMVEVFTKFDNPYDPYPSLIDW